MHSTQYRFPGLLLRKAEMRTRIDIPSLYASAPRAFRASRRLANNASPELLSKRGHPKIYAKLTRLSRVALWGSALIWSGGLFVAYLIGPIIQRLGAMGLQCSAGDFLCASFINYLVPKSDPRLLILDAITKSEN